MALANEPKMDRNLRGLAGSALSESESVSVRATRPEWRRVRVSESDTDPQKWVTDNLVLDALRSPWVSAFGAQAEPKDGVTLLGLEDAVVVCA